MSINAFYDALGSLVAAALHRRITDGEQDWYDIKPDSVIGDMLPQPVFAHIPMAHVIAAPEYAVMDRLQDLLGTKARAMLAGMYSGKTDTLTVYAIPRPSRTEPEEDFIAVPPEDQEEGYVFDETQLAESDDETQLAESGDETQLAESDVETNAEAPSIVITEVLASPGPRQQVPMIKPDYNHPRWPSPRAAHFAKALAADSYSKPKRMSHVASLQRLADHARITVDELRRVEPKDYLSKYMGPYAQRQLKGAWGLHYRY